MLPQTLPVVSPKKSHQREDAEDSSSLDAFPPMTIHFSELSRPFKRRYSMRDPLPRLRDTDELVLSRPSSLHGEEHICLDPRTISSEGPVRPSECYTLDNTPSSAGSASSDEKRGSRDEEDSIDHPSRLFAKKKYFSERGPNKNIFKKYFHPTFHQRSIQFKKIFGGTVEDDDHLLYTFSCAFQREILAQGRIFISQKNVCFYANILTWETLFAIPIKDIAAITKEKAAKIFPNSIQIETKNDEKFFFASFVNREKTYTVLETVWKNVRDDKVISPEELWEIMNPEEEEQKFPPSLKVKKENSTELMHLSGSASQLSSPLSRPDAEFPSITENGDLGSADEACEDIQCPCTSHYGRLLMDCVYPVTVEQMFNLIFTETPWFKKFNEKLKNTVYAKVSENVSGYVASEWATDKDSVKQRTCTYTMALNQAMAPKSCVVTEKQVSNHYGSDCFVVQKETHNSGVPYSDSFTVQCTYCVTKIGSGECRIRVHGGLNYKKNIWGVIKSYIEKSTNQGLDDHYAALELTLNEEVGRRSDLPGPDAEMSQRSQRIPSTSSEENLVDAVTKSADRKISTFRRDHQLTTSVSTGFNYLQQEAPSRHDFYIKIVIVLLSGLLIVNTLVLVKMFSTPIVYSSGSIDSFEERLERQQAVLSSVVESVNQVAAELQQLRNSAKNEL